MIKHILFLTFSLFAIGTSAQSDLLPTPAGDIKMTPVLHATMVLEWMDQTIYIDPYGGAEKFENFAKADLVVITHAHGDHMNKETLSGLDLSAAELIAPQSVVDELGDIQLKKITPMRNGEVVKPNGVVVEAMPMYNLPNDETARHKKGWGNAYVLTLGGVRLYISGDTEDIPEMRALKDIDYAFVCMNLPYTMTIEKAADAVLQFKPKVVYPFHYRGQNGFSDVEQFNEIVSKDNNIEVRLRNWYPEQ